MNNIQTAYVNALLANASYVQVSNVTLAEDLSPRLTPTQATYLAANFTVKASTDPAADGFNAVVWEVKAGSELAGPNNQNAGQIFVSMRGTQETQDLVDDVQLAIKGIPYKQVASMVNWWLRETAAVGNTSVKQIAALESATLSTFIGAPSATGTGRLQGLAPIASVNGHSLGGYLATAFTRIFGNAFAVQQINTFNSAGFNNLAAPKKVEVVTNCDCLNKLKFSTALRFEFAEYGASGVP